MVLLVLFLIIKDKRLLIKFLLSLYQNGLSLIGSFINESMRLYCLKN